MEERVAMFREWDSGAYGVSELARRYGVSRETFYVWKRRRDSGEERWFDDRSHAPKHCPHATDPEQVGAIVAMRRRFPGFGPEKIKSKLMEARADVEWPAPSTIGDILKREGLIAASIRRRRPKPVEAIAAAPQEPNAEWSIDFKGWFRTRDGERCDPLTVQDRSSRYLLETRIMEQTSANVRAALERLFADVGLPAAIRSDNGAPFASIGAGGLSQLSVWWLRLGIEPRCTRPGSPQDNGGHERMHRTMNEDAVQPPAETKAEQQARFDAFRRRYNEERPHAALEQTPPAKHWSPSTRRLPQRLEEPWYDAGHEVRRVRPAGTIKWRGEELFISQALAGQIVGLAELENGNRIVRFCARDLGVIDRALGFLPFAPPRTRLRAGKETQRN